MKNFLKNYSTFTAKILFHSGYPKFKEDKQKKKCQLCQNKINKFQSQFLSWCFTECDWAGCWPVSISHLMELLGLELIVGVAQRPGA